MHFTKNKRGKTSSDFSQSDTLSRNNSAMKLFGEDIFFLIPRKINNRNENRDYSVDAFNYDYYSLVVKSHPNLYHIFMGLLSLN